MEQSEFNRADREVEQVVNANHAKFRAAEQMACSDPMAADWTQCGRKMYRRKQLSRVVNTMARFLPGVLFLAAIPKGWMNPAFACLMTFASVIWALSYYTRGYRYE